MSGIYMVSAQKPTAVTHSVLGRVTSPTDLNLIICKNSLIEIYKATAEGLKFLKQIAIWGVVDTLNTYRGKHDKKDNLLVITAKYDIIVLTCEMNQNGTLEVVTKSHGCVKDTIPRQSSTHMITIVDNTRNLVAIKCYDGILKTFSLNSDNKQLNLSSLRMIDLNVIDLIFLKNESDSSVLGLLCKEPNNKILVKAYNIDQNIKEISNPIWKKEINDNQAFLIAVPEPYGGIIVVGSQSINYFNLTSNNATIKSPSFLVQGEITNYAMIDSNGQRYLLSNTIGQLFLMILISDDTSNYPKISDIRFEFLGETSIANSITYIDNGVVFIGSKLGDSQLLKLIDTPNENGHYLNILETYTNLGPILDMIVVDIEKQGQGQIITCSGGHKNGSLRIIKSGIGINESANLELPGVKSIWPLKLLDNQSHDHLLLSFFSYTKILAFSGDEFEDVEPEQFDLNNHTLHCSNVINSQILQVTTKCIRLIKDTRLVKEWHPDSDPISVASANNTEILIASRNKLFYFHIKNEDFVLVNSLSLEYEIACLDLCEDKRNFNLCAVGLWGDFSLRLFKVPDLSLITSEVAKVDVIPRSILIEYLDDIPYLFVSFGDGSVISHVISKDLGLIDRRKVVLGTQPTILKKFTSSDSKNIFACSDRPSVISSANQKLVYSSVNLKQVDYMCQLDSKLYPDSLILTSSGTLRIGTMDNLQKLHIRSLHLNETVRRICYQAETKAFGLISYRLDSVTQSVSTLCSNQLVCKNGGLFGLNETTASKSSDLSTFSDIQTIHSFIILDQNTFECLYSVQFMPNEFTLSVISIKFDENYFIVGCAQVNEDEPEPKQGRLVVFKLVDNKLSYVNEVSVKGGPYCMANLNGKLLVGISNQVKLYEFKDGQLSLLTSYSDNVFITNLQCRNDFILIGDIMKSCSVLTYRSDTNQLEQVAKDYTPVWLSSIEIIDDDNFLMCDCFDNVITLKKDSGQSNEEERKTLQNYGCMHIGEQINAFRHGSLGMQQESNELIINHHIQGSILAGTVSGSIILFSQLSNTLFRILNELQNRLAKYIITAGRIRYEKWRDFESERRVESFKNFIDGDLIECYLELTSSEAENLLKDFKIDDLSTGHNGEEFSVNYFNKLVEELSRLH
ncbi:unnamed protein product [Brachionus calyciflorus]|uniref:DNA damage-binding protein 1 n=1 Tax=Brachionus calyciflorus TaxID=104777 RepID=A0A814BP12_9BILA|nr:unnamed protein product [Brachionus calyciflorus]